MSLRLIELGVNNGVEVDWVTRLYREADALSKRIMNACAQAWSIRCESENQMQRWRRLENLRNPIWSRVGRRNRLIVAANERNQPSRYIWHSPHGNAWRVNVDLATGCAIAWFNCINPEIAYSAGNLGGTHGVLTPIPFDALLAHIAEVDMKLTPAVVAQARCKYTEYCRIDAERLAQPHWECWECGHIVLYSESTSVCSRCGVGNEEGGLSLASERYGDSSSSGGGDA